MTASRAVVTDSNGDATIATTTATEIGYVNGVTSSIQTQLGTKQATITGGATTIVSSNLTASRAMVSDGSGKAAIATTTAAEIGFVNGVTSAIQTQLNARQLSAVVSKTTSYTATATDFTILCDATGGAIVITLPAASGLSGRQYVIKKTDAGGNTVTIDGNASESIDGSTTKVITAQYEAYWIICDGSNWYII